MPHTSESVRNEAFRLADSVEKIVPGGCRWNREEIADFYAERLSSNNSTPTLDTAQELFAPLGNYPHEPLIWNRIVLDSLVREEMVRIAAYVSTELSQRDKVEDMVVRTPVEMIAELVHASGDTDILAASDDWIWSPYGAPLNSEREKDLAVAQEESNIVLLLERMQEPPEQSDMAAYHAAKYGHRIDGEQIETQIAKMYAEAETLYAERTARIDCIEEDLHRWSERVQSDQRPEHVEGLAKQRRGKSLCHLSIAEALGIMHAAQGESIEEVGWVALSTQSRCRALQRWWKRHDPLRHPEPRHDDLYVADYWWRRETASELEVARSLDGEEGFLDSLANVNFG